MMVRRPLSLAKFLFQVQESSVDAGTGLGRTGSTSRLLDVGRRGRGYGRTNKFGASANAVD